MPTWRALLPRCSPAAVSDLEQGQWVFKPALGHEGRNIRIRGVTDPNAWQRIVRTVRKDPDAWTAQRRFDVVPMPTPDGLLYPCLGVYVIDGKVAGCYGRMGSQPLIDEHCREVAVLVRPGRARGFRKVASWSGKRSLMPGCRRKGLVALGQARPVRPDENRLRVLAFHPHPLGPPAAGKFVLIADLPGEDAVHLGLALASRGYRPVPLFNACTGPGELINQLPITRGSRPVPTTSRRSSLRPAPRPSFCWTPSGAVRRRHSHLACSTIGGRCFPKIFPLGRALQQAELPTSC